MIRKNYKRLNFGQNEQATTYQQQKSAFYKAALAHAQP